MRNALAHATYPRWLYRGPYWWRSLNAWWLAWWGWLFIPGPDQETDLEKAVRLDHQAGLLGLPKEDTMHEPEIREIARHEAEKVLASQMAAALADPDVHPTSKSLAANVLKRLRPDVTEKGSTALGLD